ncbi:urea ABC transporter permease subunit UrtB [Limibaculum sp. FT325]|uniref:urea ABC transporter permease subunit UrtB n=1 Tax=Thermohalobaculum sediminis TaxID=2939436 RepID=UPI0020BFA60F|nr:urea ABC transporter permease subunit UrtB [Limibaculum sediminis]MCL5778235.1 urea ABC transporter permease subunit UrtB [Limibaculum sediminis]
MRMFALTLGLLAALLTSGAALAQPLEALVAQLPAGGYPDRARVIAAIAESGDDRAAGVLEALAAGELFALKADGRVVRGIERSGETVAVDPLTGAEIGPLGRRDGEKIKVNNALRRDIAAALGALTLMSPDPARRLAAAARVFAGADPGQIEALDAALARETDPAVRAAMMDARAASVMASDRPLAEKREAIDRLVARGDRDALSILTAAAASPDAALAAAAEAGRAEVERVRALWGTAQNLWYGLSLGSVLMLAAIGLAISFGVMGVINMAHGELVMLGAYTTYVVQEAIRAAAPGLFDWSLAIALPLAFLVSGAVGVAIERGVCRHLYGRPLETLLATWGVSLILQQAVRSVFGPTNKEVGNPSWMSGAFEIGQIAITWNRFWILIFALAVFALLLAVLKRTPMGLQMRAVTQNRRMAASMGVRTDWVDALTFGLGAGIAGLAGVALSQIDNVSPNLGQGYIVDSFMVVVFGGVGNLWGALAGAFTLGAVNKFLEPHAGAVLAKVLLLVFIILFIQRRPRGLFALKGRAVEQ